MSRCKKMTAYVRTKFVGGLCWRFCGDTPWWGQKYVVGRQGRVWVQMECFPGDSQMNVIRTNAWEALAALQLEAYLKKSEEIENVFWHCFTVFFPPSSVSLEKKDAPTKRIQTRISETFFNSMIDNLAYKEYTQSNRKNLNGTFRYAIRFCKQLTLIGKKRKLRWKKAATEEMLPTEQPHKLICAAI